ncbi:hypothetical protein [Lichenihabitans psoromatis]|uniref:hypothetical protein n=1 Tax=Lichenihabitans psoromatis TaxID=2528642 RepID=UPI0010360866|nr:hypothetical protein [Lichenihabitans psoromatis]
MSDKRKVIDKLLGFCEGPFRIVQGLCNGTKHPKKRDGINPGDESIVAQFDFDNVGACWDQGRLGSEGLRVGPIEDDVFLDLVVQRVLLAMQAFYPYHLGAVDIGCLDLEVRRQHAQIWQWRDGTRSYQERVGDIDPYVIKGEV